MLGGIFDTFEFILSLGKVRFPPLRDWIEFIYAFLCPWYYVGKTHAMVSEMETGKPINVFGKDHSSEVRYTFSCNSDHGLQNSTPGARPSLSFCRKTLFFAALCLRVAGNPE